MVISLLWYLTGRGRGKSFRGRGKSVLHSLEDLQLREKLEFARRKKREEGDGDEDDEEEDDEEEDEEEEEVVVEVVVVLLMMVASGAMTLTPSCTPLKQQFIW